MKQPAVDSQPHLGRMHALLTASMLLWGGTWPVGRLLADALHPWNAAFLRFVLASLALVVVCLKAQGRSALRVPAGLLPRLLLLGATGIFGYSALFFHGLRTTEAGRAALIVGCIPTSIALGSALIARRMPPPRCVGGILGSLLGVAVVIGNGDPGRLLQGEIRPGDVMILGCVLCWTAYTLLARPVMQAISPLVAVTWSCIFGTVLLLPFALAHGLPREAAEATWTDWAGLAYLGLAATALAYCWYYRAIRQVGPVAAGIFINLVPLFAVLLGCVFLAEPLRASAVAGGFLIVSGVWLTARRGRG